MKRRDPLDVIVEIIGITVLGFVIGAGLTLLVLLALAGRS